MSSPPSQARRWHWLLPVLCLLFPLAGWAQAQQGGGDLTVALFTTQPPTRLRLAPAGSNAWTARCATCTPQSLHAPLLLTSPTELFAGGTLQATDLGTGTERTTTGRWHVRGLAQQTTLDVTVEVPSEHYVASVLNAEAAPGEPASSLRALAVTVRTYALNGRHYAALPGHLPADLCDSTACQALRFAPETTAVRQAVDDTAGETLWFGGGRAQVFFSQHCGGITAEVDAIAPRLSATPYLRSHPDPYCLRQGPAAWHADVPLPDLYAVAAAQRWSLPRPLAAVAVTRRDRSGRVRELRFSDPAGHSSQLSAITFRLALGRALGWNLLRSDLYQLALRSHTLVLDGRGHGHGVGLCQAGAQQMAREGRSPRDILAFYFPGTSVRILSTDHGWQTSQQDDLTLAAVHSLSPQEQAAVNAAWSAAVARFPLATPLQATVRFAPSPELFRQLTSGPGWNLASTSGNTTVLQPSAVLQSRHVALEPLLLHEFLHLRVEAEATNRAPLWLREGLVEVLAGEPATSAVPLLPAAVDNLLQFPNSAAQARMAHRSAAALVQQLLHRYSPSIVRGWLISGVPVGAR